MVFKHVDIDGEYEKHKDLKREDVAALMDWASKQAHLPEINEYDGMIVLHSAYFRVERAKRIMDNYFTLRTLCPEIFYFNKNDVKRQLDNIYMFTLPQKKSTDDMIIFYGLKDPNPDLMIINHAGQASMMPPTFHTFMKGISNNVRIIVDASGGSLGHLAKLNPMIIKKYVYFLQEALPIRLKSIHFINLAPWIDRFIQLVRPFVGSELMKMARFHRNLDDLYETVPQELMPEEFGGKAGSLDELQEKSNNMMLDNFDLFLRINGMKVDETKRTGELRNELFGMSGNFKQLEFD